MEQEIRNADLSDMMCDLLYLLGCGVNEKMPAKAYIKTFQEAYDEDKMQMMYRFSKAHFVEALTGTVLKKAGVKLPTEWEQSIAKAIRKVILFDRERAEIFSYMDEQRIWHMPLKGVILKEFYPSIGMRQMSDNDILFDKDYAKQIRDYMISRGYEVEVFEQGNHDVYEKEPVYNFEMHTSDANRHRAGAVQASGLVERLYRRAGAAGRAGARRASASGAGAASAGAEVRSFPAGQQRGKARHPLSQT